VLHLTWDTLYIVQMCVILFTRKDVIMNIGPNRDGNDRVSIIRCGIVLVLEFIHL
jgi:hypothetical protein